MKRWCFIIVSLFNFCIAGMLMPACAQESLFNDAIKRGQLPSGAYIVDNKDKKNVTVDGMKDYVRGKGYVVCGYSSYIKKSIIGMKEIVSELEFITSSDYPMYAYFMMSGGREDYSQMKKGICFLPRPKQKFKHEATIVKVYGDDIDYVFDTKKDVLWSGELFSGFLHGKGAGFIINDNENYVYFEGTFEYGFPKQGITLLQLLKNRGDRGAIDVKKEVKEKIVIGVTEKMLTHNSKTTDTNLKQAMSFRNTSSYKSDVTKVEEAWQTAKSVNSSNIDNFKHDSTVVRIYNLYTAINYDPSNMLHKAKEILDAYQVIDAYQMPIKKSYYGASVYVMDWEKQQIKDDRETVSNAISIAKQGKTSSKYGFKTLYIQALPLLEAKSQKLEAKIASDKKSLDAYLEKRRQLNAPSSGTANNEIDWNYSKEPSGDIIEPSILSNADPSYQYDGKIYLKDGKGYASYNIYFKKNNGTRKIKEYKVKSTDLRLDKYSFKTRDEMLNAIKHADKL